MPWDSQYQEAPGTSITLLIFYVVQILFIHHQFSSKNVPLEEILILSSIEFGFSLSLFSPLMVYLSVSNFQNVLTKPTFTAASLSLADDSSYNFFHMDSNGNGNSSFKASPSLVSDNKILSSICASKPYFGKSQ